MQYEHLGKILLALPPFYGLMKNHRFFIFGVIQSRGD